MSEFVDISQDLAPLFLKDLNHLQEFPQHQDLQKYNMSAMDVLRAHYVVVDFCISEGVQQGVANVGPKSMNLLLSAVDRQFVSSGNSFKWSDIYHSTATLVFGIVKNHAFHDANKRTALLCAIYNMLRNGRYIDSDCKSDLEDMLVYLADDSLDIMDGFEEFEGKDDPEVEFVANFLRTKTRQQDKQMYLVTYREMDRRLRRYGFCFDNPDKNYIGVYNQSNGNQERVLRIGFPGWSRQISKGDLRKILDGCGLTPENGYDSEVIFHDADPIYYLTSAYRAQIRSLSGR